MHLISNCTSLQQLTCEGGRCNSLPVLKYLRGKVLVRYFTMIKLKELLVARQVGSLKRTIPGVLVEVGCKLPIA